MPRPGMLEVLTDDQRDQLLTWMDQLKNGEAQPPSDPGKSQFLEGFEEWWAKLDADRGPKSPVSRGPGPNDKCSALHVDVDKSAF